MGLLRMVLLWVCSGPSLFQSHTSGSSCHTPAADVIVLGIFNLIDVFHVVYKVSCTPPPILLVRILNRVCTHPP